MTLDALDDFFSDEGQRFLGRDGCSLLRLLIDQFQEFLGTEGRAISQTRERLRKLIQAAIRQLLESNGELPPEKESELFSAFRDVPSFRTKDLRWRGKTLDRDQLPKHRASELLYRFGALSPDVDGIRFGLPLGTDETGPLWLATGLADALSNLGAVLLPPSEQEDFLDHVAQVRGTRRSYREPHYFELSEGEILLLLGRVFQAANKTAEESGESESHLGANEKFYKELMRLYKRGIEVSVCSRSPGIVLREEYDGGKPKSFRARYFEVLRKSGARVRYEIDGGANGVRKAVRDSIAAGTSTKPRIVEHFASFLRKKNIEVVESAFERAMWKSAFPVTSSEGIGFSARRDPRLGKMARGFLLLGPRYQGTSRLIDQFRGQQASKGELKVLKAWGKKDVPIRESRELADEIVSKWLEG